MKSDRRFGLALIFSQLQPAKQTVKNSCREVCRSGVRFSVKNPMATEKNGGGKLLQAPAETNRKSSQGVNPTKWQCLEKSASQIPAIVLVTIFQLMVRIPFGVSYFPIGWKSYGGDDYDPLADALLFVPRRVRTWTTC